MNRPNQYNTSVTVHVCDRDTLTHVMSFSDLQQAYLWVISGIPTNVVVPRLDNVADDLERNVQLVGVRCARSSIYHEDMAYDFYYGYIVY